MKSPITLVDSYTNEELTLTNGSFLHLRLSLFFNLACCYSRMPSRIDLQSNDSFKTENEMKVNFPTFEDGAVQATELFLRAAGIYEQISGELESAKNSPNWNEIKKSLGSDLNLKTVNMLQSVMQAQALYVEYSMIQSKQSTGKLSKKEAQK
mmetsp:Transcript_9375/g.14269  ORF Transcript_9375/g.14269 Transcript_9375/m.14269 type:complete len:152 (+) Transcript_9375:383-838(+)